ncbi:MAG: hypothetical protein PHT34_06965 [Oscillospiraceae bacterium]|nr:hypothetical protein [Oscillospiraceae bacterium]
MQSKTSYFNYTVFRENITRFWPVWGGYAFIWMIALPFYIFSQSKEADSSSLVYLTGEYVLNTASVLGVALAMIFGILSAMAVFSYLFQTRSAGMFHTLPIRREGLFLSNYLAGLGFLLAPNGLIFLLTLGMEALIGGANASALLTWFLVVSGLCVFFYSFAVLCAMFTGSLLFHPILYVILNFLAVGIELLVNGALSVLLFGFSFQRAPKTGPLSPPVELLTRLKVRGVPDSATGEVKRFVLEGGGTVAIYAAVGVVLAVLALLFYRKRHTEAAGDVVAVAFLKPVFQYGVSFAAALSLGGMFFVLFHDGSIGWNAAWALMLYLLAGGFVGYYVAEMLLKKSFRVFRRGLRGYLVFAGVMLVLAAGMELDLFGYESHVPDAGSIVSVEINQSKTKDPAKIAQALAVQKSIVSEKREIESTLSRSRNLADAYQELKAPNGEVVKAQKQGSYALKIQYTLQNGNQVTRAYTVPVNRKLLADASSPAARLDRWVNDPELFFTSGRNGIPASLTTENIMSGSIQYSHEGQPVNLTQQQARTLYAAIAADVQAGAIHHEWILMDETYYASVYALDIKLDYSGRFPEWGESNELQAGSFSISPELASRNTVAALKNLGLVDETHLLRTRLESIN